MLLGPSIRGCLARWRGPASPGRRCYCLRSILVVRSFCALPRLGSARWSGPPGCRTRSNMPCLKQPSVPPSRVITHSCVIQTARGLLWKIRRVLQDSESKIVEITS